MAPKTTPGSVPADRRSALAAVRGVSLAAHAAAGILSSVDPDCCRLLRSCEGIARAAAARLEQLGRLPRAEPPGPSGPPGVPARPREAAAPPPPREGRGDAKDLDATVAPAARPSKLRKRPGKKEKTKPAKDMKVDSAAAAVPADKHFDDMDDSWADSTPLYAPVLKGVSESGPSGGGGSASASALAPRKRPPEPEAFTLALAAASTAATFVAAAVPAVPGNIWQPAVGVSAVLVGMADAQLHRQPVKIDSFRQSDGTWLCSDVFGAANYRVGSANLAPFARQAT